MALLTRFDAAAAVEIIDREGVTILMGVPTMLAGIAAAATVTALPTSSAQIVFGTLLLVVVVVDAPDLRSSLARLQARRTSARGAPPPAQIKPKAQGAEP